MMERRFLYKLSEAIKMRYEKLAKCVLPMGVNEICAVGSGVVNLMALYYHRNSAVTFSLGQIKTLKKTQ